MFTRIVTEGGLDTHNREGNTDLLQGNEVYLLFHPNILDRTDWYAYECDKYGATNLDTFSCRPSPREFFENQSASWHTGNEQMFRTGIASKDIKAIACADEEYKQEICKVLEDAGIVEIHGKSIQEMVVVTPRFKDMIALSKADTTYERKQAEDATEQKLKKQLETLPSDIHDGWL